MSNAIPSQAIYTNLSTYSPLITALGGTFIYQGFAPETVGVPYVLFYPEGGGELNNSPKDAVDLRWNVKVVDTNQVTAGTVTTLIREALHEKSATLGLGWNTLKIVHDSPFYYIDHVEGKTYVHSGGIYRIRGVDEVYVRDNFVDTNGTNLVNHSPYTGSSWANASLLSSGTAGGYTVQSNKAQGTVTNGGVVISAGMPDVAVSMVWTPTQATTEDRVYQVLRYAGDGDMIVVHYEKDGTVTISDYTSDTETQLNSGAAGGFVENTDYTLYTTIRGKQISAYVGGTLIASAQSTSHMTNTLFGFILGTGTGVGKVDSFVISQ